MSSWIIIGVFRYFVTNMRNSLSCIFRQQIYATDRKYNVDKIYNDYYNEHIRERLNLAVNEDIPDDIGEYIIKECKIKATTDLYNWNKKQYAFQIRRI